MKTCLQLNTSLHGAESLSSRLASQFVESLAQADRGDAAADAPYPLFTLAPGPRWIELIRPNLHTRNER